MPPDCMQNGFSRLVQVDSCFRGLLQRRTLYYLWAESPRMDLVGKSVVLIHPAWHSCGSHSVFCSQVDAYRALGAHVLSLAVGIGLSQNSHKRLFWNHYYTRTRDLTADERLHTGPSRRFFHKSVFLGPGLRWITANYAQQLAANAEFSPLPRPLRSRDSIDLIHCNHYFNMPLGLRLRSLFGSPIILDTHDIQAYQLELRGARSYLFHKRASVDELLQTELAYTRQADVIVHLNCEEHRFFADRIPEKPHILLYPTIRAANRPSEPHYFLIVASNNYPNYLSVSWFLDRVYPLISDIRVKIVGNINEGFAGLAPGVYARYREMFIGRVDDVAEYYDNAAAILLPTIAGHGLSIKTIEAMATGAQLVATPQAFRGINVDPMSLDNVRLAVGPIDFARHIRELDKLVLEQAPSPKLTDHDPKPTLHALPWGPGKRDHNASDKRRQRNSAATRRIFDQLFSFEQYVGGIAQIADMLLNDVAPAAASPLDEKSPSSSRLAKKLMSE